MLYAQQHAIAQSGDSKRVAAYLAANAKPGAVIAIFPADALPAYARQYRGSARLIPFPKALPRARYDLTRIDAHDEREVLLAFEKLRTAPQLWLVMLGTCDNREAGYGCEKVLAAVYDGTRIESERRFFESRVFSLDIRSERRATAQARAN